MKTHRSHRYAALLVFGSLFLPGSVCAATQQDDASPASILLSRARTLEQRGRLDLARQDWAQVLTLEPNEAQALAGMVRAARAEGKQAEAAQYLSRLRAAHPRDAELARLEESGKAASNDRELVEAERLSSNGDYRAAFVLYKRIYGLTPPAGAPALAYYQAEAGTDEGRPQAIAGLRALSDRYPGDSRYPVLLGRVLLQSQRTQAEGRTLLEQYPGNAEASAALQAKDQGRAGRVGTPTKPLPQSTVSTMAKPSPVTPLQVETHLPQQPSGMATRAAVPSSGLATASGGVGHRQGFAAQEQAAYLALNQHRTTEAEALFTGILAQAPTDARALAGLGYLHILSGDTKGAVLFFERAQESGDRSLALTRALVNAQFALTLQKASAARLQGDIPGAEEQYRTALQERPGDAEALEGLGGLLLQSGRASEATPVFARLTRVRPMSPAAWRGLVISQATAGKAQSALEADARVPADVRSPLQHDASYQQALETARVEVPTLAAKLEPAPRPSSGRTLEPPGSSPPARPQEAQAGSKPPVPQPATVAPPEHTVSVPALPSRVQPPGSAVPTVVAGNTKAAQNGVAEQKSSGVQASQTKPPVAPVRSGTKSRRAQAAPPTVVATVPPFAKPKPAAAAPDAEANARTAQAIAIERTTQGNAALQHGESARAIDLYRDALREQPGLDDASRGLVEALHASGRDTEALAVMNGFPEELRLNLDRDATFQKTSGDIFLAAEDPGLALHSYAQAQAIFASQQLPPPLVLLLRITKLLSARGDDENLYRELVYVDSRQDLDDRQRREVQATWTQWAVHRARLLSVSGDQARAVTVLNAAAEAFAGNVEVFFAVADGYAGIGLPKEAVALYKQRDLSLASAPQVEAAIHAGIAARNFKAAESWAHSGRERFPNDGSMLNTLAELKQAKGHEHQAMELSRQARSIAPAQNPGQVLTAELRNAGAGYGWRSAENGQLSALLPVKEASDALSRLGSGRPYIPLMPTGRAEPATGSQVPLLSGLGQTSR